MADVATLEAKQQLYALAFSTRPDQPLLLCCASISKNYEFMVVQGTRSSKGQVSVDPDPSLGGLTPPENERLELSHLARIDLPNPAVSTSWVGDQSCSLPNLVASAGDCVRIFGELQSTGGNQNASPQSVWSTISTLQSKDEYESPLAVPLTGMDWHISDPSSLVTSSMTGLVHVWDVAAEKLKARVIAHETSSCFDVRFSPKPDVFITAGEDGSVRMFDSRALEYSTVLYEKTDRFPMMRVEFNQVDSNYVSCFRRRSHELNILDVRLPGLPVLTLDTSVEKKNELNAACFAPDSAFHIATCGENGKAYVWDLSPLPDSVTSPVLQYNAKHSVNNVAWNWSGEWLGITFSNKLQVLHI